MKLFLILLSSCLLLVSISLGKAFPVDPEEDDEVAPEYLKPASDNVEEDPPAIEEDEGMDEEVEFGENTELDDSEGLSVPILIPGKENKKRRSALPEVSPLSEEPYEDTEEMSEESESIIEPMIEQEDMSEEGDEPSGYDRGIDTSSSEESPEQIQFEDSDEVISRHARSQPMTSKSKRPNPNKAINRANQVETTVMPSSNTIDGASENPGSQDEDDTIIVEACGDYEDTCGSNALIRSDDVACRAYRETCEDEETGDFIDTFFCPNGDC